MSTHDGQASTTGHGPDAAHATPLAILLVVFLALVAMTGLTVWVAYVDLGVWNTPVAIAIATIKALLVIVIFMEMRFAEPLTWLAATTGLLFLLLLIGLTMADVTSRGWLGIPGH